MTVEDIKQKTNWKTYKSYYLETEILDAKFLSENHEIPIDFTPVWLNGNSMIITKTRDDWYVQKVLKEYGASKLNGKNMKHTSGSGNSRKSGGGGNNKSPKVTFDPPPYNIEDIHKFNYSDMLLCKEDMKFDKIYRLQFTHIFYKPWQIKMYNDIQKRYYKDLNNGTIDKISVYTRKLSTYIRENKLCINNNDENYIEGSVICNIALMISKYLKTGNFDIDIDWINKLDINQLNDFDNIYVLFLLLQIFSCKYKYKKMYINGRFIRDWWAVNLIRRRDKNQNTKTLGILPKFNRNQFGDTIYELY